MMSYKDSPKHVQLAERLCAEGFMVLRFDFSGRGESQGDLMGLTYSRQVAECERAAALMRARGVKRLALVGSSMGGAVAILVAAKGGVAALATLAAVGRTDRLPERFGLAKMARWREVGHLHFEGERVGYSLVEDSREFDIPAAAGHVSCPWIILHGQDDEILPISDAEALHAGSSGRAILEIVSEADHRFSSEVHRRYVIDRIAGFLVTSVPL